MKKGATHADWAISLGIFLVYILSMFMILQPGSQPIYKDEQMMGIVKSGLIADTRFVLTKTPMVIIPVPANFSGAAGYTVEITGTFPLEKGGTKAALFSEAGEYMPNAKIDLEANPKKITFNALMPAETKKFWIYEITTPDTLGDAYEYDNSFSQTNDIISSAKANFTFMFGSPEVMEGIDIAKFALPFPEGVQCTLETYKQPLKNQWSYPLNKDFAVYYVMESSPQYAETDKIDVCSPVKPYDLAQVFVDEWAANKLDKEGKTSPLRINARIW